MHTRMKLQRQQLGVARACAAVLAAAMLAVVAPPAMANGPMASAPTVSARPKAPRQVRIDPKIPTTSLEELSRQARHARKLGHKRGPASTALDEELQRRKDAADAAKDATIKKVGALLILDELIDEIEEDREDKEEQRRQDDERRRRW